MDDAPIPDWFQAQYSGTLYNSAYGVALLPRSRYIRTEDLLSRRNQLMPGSQKIATFVEPMDCLSVSKLPEGSQWLWELKWDGYRAIAIKGSTVKLYSRNLKPLDKKFRYICEALHELPSETVVDGEIAALDVDRDCNKYLRAAALGKPNARRTEHP